jgi:hypothetical protein
VEQSAITPINPPNPSGVLVLEVAENSNANIANRMTDEALDRIDNNIVEGPYDVYR